MKMANISPCSGSRLLSQHLQWPSKSPLIPLQVQLILQKRRLGPKLTDWWSRKKLRTLKLLEMDWLMQMRITRWKIGTTCWCLQSRRMLEEKFPPSTHVLYVVYPRRKALRTGSRTTSRKITSQDCSLITAPVHSAPRPSSPRVSWGGISRKHTRIDCGELKCEVVQTPSQPALRVTSWIVIAT